MAGPADKTIGDIFMGVTPLTFTGTSTYASDFQSILTRAVGIANIPLQQLENQDTTVLNQKSQLGSVNAAISGLTSAVQALGALGASQAISAVSSSPSTVTVTSNGATSAATYTVNSVTSLATAASETSISGYGDSSATPVSSTGDLNLTLGANNYPIHLTTQTNNLVGLQNAINGLGAGVTASILTTGNGNYLSLSANSLGATTLRLNDDPSGANTNLLTTANQGTDAVFQLNNLKVTRSQNTVNDLIPGATITLQAPSSAATTLSLAPDPNQLSSGLQSFVAAYNSVVDQVNGQTGLSAGVLVGDPVILQIESTLRTITGYQGSGQVTSLSDLGISLGSNGKMTFDSSAISRLSNDQVAGALKFLGTATSGFGGMAQSLSAIGDPIQGSIANEENTLTQSDAKLQAQISQTTASINRMQTTLLQQLSQADSLITTLTSQQNELTASVQSLNYVMYGKPTGS